MGAFLSEAVRLFEAERRLKKGEMEPDEFVRLKRSMSRSEEAFRFFRATVLAILHIPLTDVPYLLGFGIFVPLLSALLLSGAGGLQVVFAFYVVVRGLVGLQDTYIMVTAHRGGHIPFTSSLFGTILGTLPYPYAHVVGPILWTVVEVLLYLVVYLLPGLLAPLETVFPGLLSAVATVGVVQIAWHTLVRGAANLVVLWEIPRLSDPDTFHRIRAKLWGAKNRLLGRSRAEVEEAEEQWYKLRRDLQHPVWADLDHALEHLSDGPRGRVKRYLLASRKDEIILRELLSASPSGP